MPYTRKSSGFDRVSLSGKKPYQHWYRDNQVYMITARCRGRFCAFEAEKAKLIFWDRFDHYTRMHSFEPWVTSLMDNHYHTLGYLHHAQGLGPMMRKFHGSVAKLVNDTLESRLLPFWYDLQKRDYFDGCIRNEKQCRLAYRYIMLQGARHGIVKDWREYIHTRILVDLEQGVARALELKAFLEGVPYRRYGE